MNRYQLRTPGITQREIDMIRKTFGVLAFLIGVTILAWIGYNYLIEMQPAAEGRNPIPALLFSAAAIFVGIKMFLGKKQVAA